MRDYKFRVWRKNTNTMLVNEVLQEILLKRTDSKTVKGSYPPRILLPLSGVWIPDNPDCVVMQYTGRLDINDKEVYEGDIVHVRDFYGKSSDFHGVVMFRDCSFVIKTEGFSHYRWMDYEVEVVGNIFENEDMLEDLDILEMVETREKNDNGKRYSLDEIKKIFNIK